MSAKIRVVEPIAIGIAGGSGAGKTSLAEGLVKWLGGEATILHLDDYYIKATDMPKHAGVPNWDDPRSIDHEALRADLAKALHTRNENRVIIVEGFLLLHYPDIRELLEVSIFLKAPHDVINERRIHAASKYYRENVIKPMYEKYVLPTAKHADYVVDVSKATQGEILVHAIALLKPHL